MKYLIKLQKLLKAVIMAVLLSVPAAVLLPAGTVLAEESTSFSRYNPETNVEYRNYKKLGEEIRQVLTQVRKDVREKIEQAAAPKAAVTCPYCGATTTPDATGCCEYCGGAVNG